jgi:hypothetical protein
MSHLITTPELFIFYIMFFHGIFFFWPKVTKEKLKFMMTILGIDKTVYLSFTL